MTRTAVIFAERATLGTLVDFKDALSSTLLSILEPWTVEFKTYRYQVKNIPSDEPKLMCSITFSNLDKKTVLLKNNICMVTAANLNILPEGLLSNGCCGDTPESIDTLLSTKLSNIWSQRQSIRGEGGETFETTDLIVRAVNMFSSTGFKGLLIELTSKDDGSLEDFSQKVNAIQDILRGIDISEVKVSSEQLNADKSDHIGDLAHQYVRVLNF